MAFTHGKGAGVLVGEYNLSPYLSSYESSKTLEVAETTTFTATAKTFIPGLLDATLSMGGFFDGAVGAVDEILEAALGAAAPKVVTLLPAGAAGGTIGDRAQLCVADETTYGASAAPGDAVSITAEFQATGGLWGGVLLHPLTARTAAANYTAVDNAASSANGYVANVHVTAFDGTDVVIKVQHSTDNSSWSDLVTFATVSGVTSERKTATGTVNRYVRAIISSGTFTSVTFAVAFSRK